MSGKLYEEDSPPYWEGLGEGRSYERYSKKRFREG